MARQKGVDTSITEKLASKIHTIEKEQNELETLKDIFKHQLLAQIEEYKAKLSKIHDKETRLRGEISEAEGKIRAMDEMVLSFNQTGDSVLAGRSKTPPPMEM